MHCEKDGQDGDGEEREPQVPRLRQHCRPESVRAQDDLPDDRGVKGILVLDCSWNQAKEVFFRKLGGKHRRLPGLLAANPTNYSRLGILSSLEALAGSLFIIGEDLQAEGLLALYKWGPTFETLNHEPREAYKNARSEAEVLKLEREFFPQLYEWDNP